MQCAMQEKHLGWRDWQKFSSIDKYNEIILSVSNENQHDSCMLDMKNVDKIHTTISAKCMCLSSANLIS